MASSAYFDGRVHGFDSAEQVQKFVGAAFTILDPPAGTDGGLMLHAGLSMLRGTTDNIREYEMRHLLRGGPIEIDFSIRRGSTDQGLLLMQELSALFPGLAFELRSRHEDSPVLDARHYKIQAGAATEHDWRLAPPTPVLSFDEAAHRAKLAAAEAELIVAQEITND